MCDFLPRAKKEVYLKLRRPLMVVENLARFAEAPPFALEEGVVMLSLSGDY